MARESPNSEERGWTQEELARRAGLESKRTISSAERGKEKYLGTMLQIANALSVDVADITITESLSGGRAEGETNFDLPPASDASVHDELLERIWPYIESYFLYELSLIDRETATQMDTRQPQWRKLVAGLLGVDGETVRKYLPAFDATIDDRQRICQLWMENALSIGQSKNWPIPPRILEKYAAK